MKHILILPVAVAVLLAAFEIANADSPMATGGDTTWTANSWDDAVQTLPCKAFRQNADKSWTMPGTVKLTGSTSVISNMTVNASEGASLTQRCGATAGNNQ